MKKLVSILLLGATNFAMAGELETADKLLRAKAYDKALPLYSALAQAGDPEAQFRLGEMYWYGDGTAVDLAAANTWLQKAAQRGHQGAIESLEILKQREARSADIAYWISGQAGARAEVSGYDCAAPALPEDAKSRQAMKEAANRYKEWQACYDGFAARINAQVRAAPQIPEDVLKLMTPREAEQAYARLNGDFTRTIARAEREAMRITGEYMAWQHGTDGSVLTANSAKNFEYQILKRRAEEREMNFRPRPQPSLPTGAPLPGTTGPGPGR
jgi:hypothetical protein